MKYVLLFVLCAIACSSPRERPPLSLGNGAGGGVTLPSLPADAGSDASEVGTVLAEDLGKVSGCVVSGSSVLFADTGSAVREPGVYRVPVSGGASQLSFSVPNIDEVASADSIYVTTTAVPNTVVSLAATATTVGRNETSPRSLFAVGNRIFWLSGDAMSTASALLREARVSQDAISVSTLQGTYTRHSLGADAQYMYIALSAAGAGGSVARMSLSGSGPAEPFAVLDDAPHALVASDQGVFVALGNRIVVLDKATGALRDFQTNITTAGPLRVIRNTLLVARTGEDAGVWAYPLAGGEGKLRFAASDVVDIRESSQGTIVALPTLIVRLPD